jgi:hypothetical protein
MKLILFTLMVIFVAWLFDITPMTNSVTGYRAQCEGTLLDYKSCHGTLKTGEAQSFTISPYRNEVLQTVAGGLPQPLGECKVGDRHNWKCTKRTRDGLHFYWMTNGLYAYNRTGGETDMAKDNTIPVTRLEWVGLYLANAPKEVMDTLQNIKEEHFQNEIRKVMQ